LERERVTSYPDGREERMAVMIVNGRAVRRAERALERALEAQERRLVDRAAYERRIERMSEA
jgi:hypothetical protein